MFGQCLWHCTTTCIYVCPLEISGIWWFWWFEIINLIISSYIQVPKWDKRSMTHSTTSTQYWNHSKRHLSKCFYKLKRTESILCCLRWLNTHLGCKGTVTIFGVGPTFLRSVYNVCGLVTPSLVGGTLRQVICGMHHVEISKYSTNWNGQT